MEKIRVNMMTKNGNKALNQFIISTEEGEYFQSYESVILFTNNNGKITLDRDGLNSSTTTGKYRNMYLGETKKQTQAKIKSGEYALADLN